MNESNLWSLQEVDAAFDAYLWMYREQAAGRTFVKRALIRELQNRVLVRRTKSSIEKRFQNFSSIFLDHGLSFVSGYVPLDHVGPSVERRVLDLMKSANLIPSSIPP
jgi:hypothetical protein